MAKPVLGVIEGFYGPVWPWPQRRALADRLAAHGYSFWHYAPKADAAVREDWRRGWDDDHARELQRFGAFCRERGMRFGIGLSPLGLTHAGPDADWQSLARRLAELDAIGIDELLLCFDDQRGDRSDLATEQARIVEWAAARTHAQRVVVCPTYYSDDPLLDTLFGPRPPAYLATLGAALDERIAVYWAGEAICPREILPGHVERVAQTLRRPPWLWDNYPVNDGPRAREHLHLRAFTGRPQALADVAAAHAINPALQPVLTAIPALTLPERYRRGDTFEYTAAFERAAQSVLGDELAACVTADLPLLEDAGRECLDAQGPSLRARYAAFDHPGAREIVRWLDGELRATTAAPAASDGPD